MDTPAPNGVMLNQQMHKAIDEKLIRIEMRLDRLLAQSEQQGRDLVAQNIILAEHQRRTTVAEKRLDGPLILY